MTISPELEIVWDGGSLDLLGVNDTPFGPVMFEAQGEGTQWGGVESIRRDLLTALAYGAASVTDGYNNRTVVIKLCIEAPDSAALAGGEAALHRLSEKRRAELRWTPPNDYAAAAVFEVVASDLVHDMDDLGENKIERYYTLTLSCLPFVLSIDPVTIEALPPFVGAPSVITPWATIDGWSTSNFENFVAAMDGSDLRIATDGTDVTVPTHGWVRYSETVTMTKRYLAIKSEASGANITVGNLGADVLKKPVGISTDGDWAFFDIGAGVVLDYIQFPQVALPGLVTYARYYDLAESDSPSTAPGRQSLRAIPTPGSAPTSGSLLIESRDDATPLNEVILYTGPRYDPRLSHGRQEFDVAYAGNLSGGHAEDRTVFTFYRYAEDFPPGPYAIWANPVPFGVGAPSLLSWTVQIDLVNESAVPIVNLPTLLTTTSHPGGAGGMQPFGIVDLPGVELLARPSPYRLKFTFTSSAAATWDEGLLFHGDGDLSVIDMSASQSNRVQLQGATLEHEARVLRGYGGTSIYDLGVSMVDEIRAWSGRHQFTPDETYLYVGTTGSEDPRVTGMFRPAHHTHPPF